jgi:cation-transporting ATPase E
VLFACQNSNERLIPCVLFSLTNPLRPYAAEMFSYFRKNQVAIKVLSGDDPATVSQIAKNAGIPDAGSFCDVSSINMDDAITPAMADSYTIFGRMLPHQKRQLVEVLQHTGHTVAMTGDGINDVLALKSADISIAPACGSQAAVQTAKLVLLDSDFSQIPAIVSEGQRLVTNLIRCAALFLIKNIFSLLLSVFSILCFISYPLEPSQISLVSLITIGIPGFFLSLDSRTHRVSDRFLLQVFHLALPPALTDFILISGFSLLGTHFGYPHAEIATACTILLTVVGLSSVVYLCKPMQKTHWILLFSLIGGMVFCTFVLSDLFQMEPLSPFCLLLLLSFCLLSIPCKRLLRFLLHRLY